ncbi:MAG TPA: biopolymer transporter TolR [Chitinophagaceae bacterium]|nr:biopolymer transporter TolR [Chitinophagaceae bacterium]
MKKTLINFEGINLALLSLLFISLGSTAQTRLPEPFVNRSAIGDPKLKGSIHYNPEDQTYQLKGAGSNMWAGNDQFEFAWKKVKGDFMIRATIRFIGQGKHEHRKIGIMAREDLDGGSRYADACVHGDHLSSLQYRLSPGDTTGQVILSSYHPTEIALKRSGNVFTFSAASFGENYKSVSKEIALPEELYTGIFICSHDENVLENAEFSNVRIELPAPAGFRPYRDYIGSNLEIMDVQTGKRKILHRAPNSLQAPNWTHDGQFLIYNAEGLLYKYNLENGGIEKLNTGTASSNNNDHVLSFDGKMMGLSNHSGPNRISTLYVMPLDGTKEPVQISSVEAGHSYLHSWSPDGSKLIFTGQRNNQFDIWSIDIKSKKETALTNTPTLDDGAEYSPDGKFIYFNSVRTGTMKIWRMRPDGSQQEQITFDEYNDWFPHISPDGQWIVYLSFPKDIDPTSHPFYQEVYIRLMPARGGVPKTIAYLYGGQGTINVPSWSPDSNKIAFISNTRLHE